MWLMCGVDGVWCVVFVDCVMQVYNFGWWDDCVYYYVVCECGDQVFGFGECVGEFDCMGVCFEMCNIDVMGYSVKYMDLLYKYILFYIIWLFDVCQGFGLFYDMLLDCLFDMGCEFDNYYGLYCYFVVEYGDFDYYFIVLFDMLFVVVWCFMWLIGCLVCMLKWGFGYLGLMMSYIDVLDVQQQMNQFVEQCDVYDILCDLFYLLLGYMLIGVKCYVFNWNCDKFFDVKGFVQYYCDYGICLCVNIKLCLLCDYLVFDDVVQCGLLICLVFGEFVWVQFWDEVGVYFDFMQLDVYCWWCEQVMLVLLEYGIELIWNDNNEYEIWLFDVIVYGFGQLFLVCEVKVLQMMLMMCVLCDVQCVYVLVWWLFFVLCFGGVGMQCYVQMWFGDNYMLWEMLCYNLKMGFGFVLLGVLNIGYDIGGFFGFVLLFELLLCWVQFGIFMLCFSIYLWNDDGIVNELWMYLEIIVQIVLLIKQCYWLLLYFYYLLWLLMMCYEFVLWLMFVDFFGDVCCYDVCDDMMFGDVLLVVLVVDFGQIECMVYLLLGVCWICCVSVQLFDGGVSVMLFVLFDMLVMLLCEGCVLLLNVVEQYFGVCVDMCGFFVVLWIEDGVVYGECVEDDGEMEVWCDGEYGLWCIEIGCEVFGVFGVLVCWDGWLVCLVECVEILLFVLL